MEWRDQGVLLSVRAHGETSAIVEVFTKDHGRHAGVVPGGASRKKKAMLQPGSQLAVFWRARLEDSLGTFTVEPLQSRAGLMADRRTLSALNAVCGLLHVALPERAAHTALWHATMDLLAALEAGDGWQAGYLHWELRLLEDLGFGLDLATCAVTGAREGLAFVSPRTGRAVSRAGAGDWADRLMPLPPCLRGGIADAAGLAQGLAITGHFLARELAPTLGGRLLPDARARLVDLLSRPE